MHVVRRVVFLVRRETPLVDYVINRRKMKTTCKNIERNEH